MAVPLLQALITGWSFMVKTAGETMIATGVMYGAMELAEHLFGDEENHNDQNQPIDNTQNIGDLQLIMHGLSENNTLLHALLAHHQIKLSNIFPDFNVEVTTVEEEEEEEESKNENYEEDSIFVEGE